MTNKFFTIAMLTALLLTSCKESNDTQNLEKKSVEQTTFDVATEVEKWKKELVDSNKLGEPCVFESHDSPEAKKWRTKFPEQFDGFPVDENEIGIINEDFDADGKSDLLMQFVSENCVGHNGGTPTFAKIIYSNGKVNGNLMEEIRQAIIDKYNEKRVTDKNLKKMTDDFLDTTAGISSASASGIIGYFNLYGENDAHCCPSLDGDYTYDVINKKIDIITEKHKEMSVIDFKIAENYFVKNYVKKLDNPKIETAQKFNEIFGMATKMGKDGRPTVIDFNRQYVIAVILPETDLMTTIAPIVLFKDEKGKILLTYKTLVGQKQSFKIRPTFQIIVDKSVNGEIEIKEFFRTIEWKKK